jgi:hypothetical protein
MTPAERGLLFRALLRVASTRLALWLLPWPMVRKRVHRVTAERNSKCSGPTIPQVVWAIEAASRRIPGAGNCLVQALAARTLLAHYGYPATIHVGVRTGSGTRFGAHAWVSCAGQTVIGRTADPFVPLGSAGI